MTGFWPSGWDDGTALTVKMEGPCGFSFERLSGGEHLIEFSGVILISIAEPVLQNTLASFVLEYTFTGNIRGLSGPIGEAMVEYGVSRFKGNEAQTDVVQTDEPLAILALVTFFEQKGLTLEAYLRDALNTSNAASRGIAFEAFGAYILALAFSKERPLSEVFEFVEGGKKVNKALRDAVAELVTLEKVGDNFQTAPLQIETNLRSSHVLGCSPRTSAETLEWLQNPEGSAFCFPANPVGPDLIFVLRLTSDNTVLRVCVQFKHTQTLSPKDSEKAIRTTDPSTFLSQRAGDKNSLTCSDPLMRAKMEEAIKNLGNGTKKAGPCGLLRVVISHPSHPDSNTLEKAAKGNHPLATVSLGDLDSRDSDLGQIILSLANQALQIPDRKRKSSDEIEGARPKRQKGGTDTGTGQTKENSQKKENRQKKGRKKIDRGRGNR